MRKVFLTLILTVALGTAYTARGDEPIDVQILSSKGEYFKALVTYDKLPKRRITTEATIAAAKSAWALSLSERAIAEFEKALQDTKLDATERGRIYLSRGIIEFQEARYQVASLYGEKATNQISTAGPLRAKALLLHGESLARLGNYGSAEERLIQALEESSEEDEAEIRYQLGDCLMRLNKFKEAEEHLQAVPLGHDRTPMAVRKLGEIALSLNNPDQALFWLNKGRSEYPDSFLDSWVDYALVQAALGKKDVELAHQFQEVANSKFARSDFWLSMLNASFEVGQWHADSKGVQIR